jgi:hypothetical protein
VKGSQTVRITARDGLVDDFISQILSDDLGRIWLNSNAGVSRIDPVDFDFFASGKTKWLRVASFARTETDLAAQTDTRRAGWCCRMVGHELWFSYGNGILIVNPLGRATNHVLPPVTIESALVDGQVLATNSPALPPKLPPNHGKLQFQFTALSLDSPENVQFRYMLDGYDKEWTDAGINRQAIYSRLDAGNYRFRVIACNRRTNGGTNPYCSRHS